MEMGKHRDGRVGNKIGGDGVGAVGGMCGRQREAGN